MAEDYTFDMEANESVDDSGQSATKIRSIGPSDRFSGTEVLRYQPDDKRKSAVDIRRGQILTVGEEITQEEAERLLSLNAWKFEGVE